MISFVLEKASTFLTKSLVFEQPHSIIIMIYEITAPQMKLMLFTYASPRNIRTRNPKIKLRGILS
jgi:hypothetical protein